MFKKRSNAFPLDTLMEVLAELNKLANSRPHKVRRERHADRGDNRAAKRDERGLSREEGEGREQGEYLRKIYY